MRNKGIWVCALLAVALTAAAFLVAPPAPSASEEQLKRQLAEMREAFEAQASEILKLRKEVHADVAEIRRTEYTRRKALPADDVAVGLAALLEESRLEHAADEL